MNLLTYQNKILENQEKFDIYYNELIEYNQKVNLTAITEKIYMAMTIFTICSFCFTYLGLILGKYCNKLLGVYSSVIGSFLLLIIGIIHLFK